MSERVEQRSWACGSESDEARYPRIALNSASSSCSVHDVDMMCDLRGFSLSFKSLGERAAKRNGVLTAVKALTNPPLSPSLNQPPCVPSSWHLLPILRLEGRARASARENVRGLFFAVGTAARRQERRLPTVEMPCTLPSTVITDTEEAVVGRRSRPRPRPPPATSRRLGDRPQHVRTAPSPARTSARRAHPRSPPPYAVNRHQP